MKIIQIFKYESGYLAEPEYLALDDKGNIFKIILIGNFLNDGLKFIKIKQFFEDRIKE